MNKDYPVDYITYYKNNKKIPDEVPLSLKRTKKMGYYVLPLTPDDYNDIPPFHAGFKHMRDITIPKIKKLLQKNKKIKGFFIAEGDLYIYDGYDFKTFLSENHKEPIWLGYKKRLSNYVVGNFLLYFPRSHFSELEKHFLNQKKLIFSDRFFTKLVDKNFIKLKDKSIATEIEHYSMVFKGIRKSNVKMAQKKLMSKTKKKKI